MLAVQTSAFTAECAQCLRKNLFPGASNSSINRVLCTGHSGAAVWAQLCGPWAQITYPAVHTRVITFGGPKWAYCLWDLSPLELPLTSRVSDYAWMQNNASSSFEEMHLISVWSERTWCKSGVWYIKSMHWASLRRSHFEFVWQGKPDHCGTIWVPLVCAELVGRNSIGHSKDLWTCHISGSPVKTTARWVP